MRIYALCFVLTVAASACDDDNKNNNNKLDMTMGEGEDLAGADLSISGNDDLSMADMAMVPLVGIAAVRAAGDKGQTPDGGMLAMAIPVTAVYVTYIRPEIPGEADDPPGFFVQAEQTGPALFLRVDPASLSPAPLVGDLVQFTVTGAGTDSGGVHQAISITDWAVQSSGNSLSPLVQDLSSATDLVTGITGYESELSTVTGAVSGGFTSSGNAYVQAFLTTAGIPGSTGNPKLRIPATLRDAVDVTNGCAVTVGPTPMWRFKTSAEPSAWVTADITVSSCPAPKLLSAAASDSTHVVLTFDRFIKAASFAADGSQFTFNNGLTVDTGGAVQSTPNTVTINTTAQTGATAYTVTAAASLLDTRDTPVDPANDSAVFAGFVAPAKLIINEFNDSIMNSQDMIELKVLQGGSVSGFTIYQDFVNRSTLATLPTNLIVDTGDFILVHLAVDPSPAPVVTELNVGVSGTKVMLQAQCTSTACVTGAWDVAATKNGLTHSSDLITLTDASNVVQDVVAYAAGTLGSMGDGAEFQAAIDGNYWATPCVSPSPTPISCGDAVTKSTLCNSSGVNVKTPALSTAGANSVQRTSDVVPSGQSNWHTAASSWGLPNN